MKPPPGFRPAKAAGTASRAMLKRPGGLYGPVRMITQGLKLTGHFPPE